MPSRDPTDTIDTFTRFYQLHYDDDITTLCEGYPTERRSLYINWATLNTYDAVLADDFIQQPAQFLEYAEEALRIYDTPGSETLG